MSRPLATFRNLCIASLVAILCLFTVVLGLRVTAFVNKSRPLGNSNYSVETNSGVLSIQRYGLFPRDERVLVASEPDDRDYAIVGSRSQDSLSVVSLEEGDIIWSSTYRELGFFRELPNYNNEIFLFDLELARGRLFASLVATDRKPGTCDSYSILEMSVNRNLTLNKARKVWQSSICRSVVSETYFWPDFTGRLAYAGDALFLTSGLSSMNMITERFPEPAMGGGS